MAVATDQDKLAAAEQFVETWERSGLAESLIEDYTCHLGCGEAEAFAGLFRTFGHPDIADIIIEDHTRHDTEPGDSHYTESEH